MSNKPLFSNPASGRPDRAAVFALVRRLPAAWMLLAALAAGGCSDHPRTVVVRGLITYEGAPLEGGEITFQPLHTPDGLLRRPAIGQIQSDGTYELSTFAKGDGALPGEYAVVLTSYIGKPPIEELELSPPARPSRIPLKYTSAATSELRATIPSAARGPLTFDFEVK